MAFTINSNYLVYAPDAIDTRMLVDRVDGTTSSLVSLDTTFNYRNMYVWVREEKSFYYLIDSPEEGGATVSDWTQASGGVGGSASAIDFEEIAFGTGTGITSSNYFTWNNTCNNLIASKGSKFVADGISITSPNSAIIGGTGNSIYQAALGGPIGSNLILGSENSIVGTFSNIISDGNSLSIISGNKNTIGHNSERSTLIAGCTNIGRGVLDSVIIGGTSSCIKASRSVNIIGANRSFIYLSCESTIIAGSNNDIINSDSSLISGDSNYIYDSSRSAIIGGVGNSIGTQSQTLKQLPNSTRNVIIGGSSNEISGSSSYNSSIIGGYTSYIKQSKQSVILGGIGLTLSSEDSVVYVPKLKIATASNDESSTKVLVWGTNNYVGYKDASGLGGGSFLPLPVPKINLMQGTQEVQVYNSATNTISATSAVIHNYPVLINMDFTSDHFSNPNNKIFIEMVYYRRKSRKTYADPTDLITPIIKKKGKSYVVPAKHKVGEGQDITLPWIAAAMEVGATGSWSRSGNSYWSNGSPGSSVLLGIDRPNHVEVTSYTMSSYPIWEYLNGRFEFYDVAYRSPTSPTQSTMSFLNTLIPNSGKGRTGPNNPTSRFAYSAYYTPYYCAFRYIQWIPSANGGRGQIVSGPLSKVIKVTGLRFPFQTNYQKSATQIPNPIPVCDISTRWTTDPDSYKRLKCDWESNLP